VSTPESSSVTASADGASDEKRLPLPELVVSFGLASNAGDDAQVESIRALLAAHGLLPPEAADLETSRALLGSFRVLQLADSVAAKESTLEAAVAAVFEEGWWPALSSAFSQLLYAQARDREWIEAGPESWLALLGLAQAVAAQGRHDVLAFDAAFIFGAGFRESRPREAIAHLEKARALAETARRGELLVPLLRYLADAYGSLGRSADAVRVLDELQSRGALSAAARMRRECEIFEAAGQIRYALERAEALAALKNDIPNALFGAQKAGEIFAGMARHEQAIAKFNEALVHARALGDRDAMRIVSKRLVVIFSVREPLRTEVSREGAVDAGLLTSILAFVEGLTDAPDWSELQWPAFPAGQLRPLVTALLAMTTEKGRAATTASRLARAARELVLRGDEPDLLAIAESVLGDLAFDDGDLPEASARYATAANAVQQLLSDLADDRGELEPGTPLLEQATRLQLNSLFLGALQGETGVTAAMLANLVEYGRKTLPLQVWIKAALLLADLTRAYGPPAAAVARYATAAAGAKEAGLDADEAAAEFFLAVVLHLSDRDEEALSHLERVIALTTERDPFGEHARGQLAIVRVGAADALIERGEHEAAKAHLEAVIAATKTMPALPGRSLRRRAIFLLASLLKGEEAVAYLQQQVTAGRERRDPLHTITALDELAVVLAQNDDRDAAVATAHEALTLAREYGVASTIERMSGLIGDLTRGNNPPAAGQSDFGTLDLRSAATPEDAELMVAAESSLPADFVSKVLATYYAGQLPMPLLTGALRGVIATAAAVPALERGRALVHLAKLAMHNDLLDIAEQHFAAARKILEQGGEAATLLLGECDGGEGAIHMLRGNLRRAAELFERAAEVRRNASDEVRFAAAAGNLGAIYFGLDEHDKARYWYEEAVSLRIRQGNGHGAVTGLCILAQIAVAMGHSDFRGKLEQARHIAEISGPEDVLHVLVTQAKLERGLQEYERASAAAESMESVAREASLTKFIIDALLERGQVAEALGDAAKALELYDRACEEAFACHELKGAADAAVRRAEVRATTDPVRATAEVEETLARLRAAGEVAPASLLQIAEAFFGATEHGRATDLAREAYERATEAQAFNVAVNALRFIGQIGWYLGDLEKAKSDLLAAAALEERLQGRISSGTLNALGMVARDLGDLGEAVKYLMANTSVDAGSQSLQALSLLGYQLAEFDRADEAMQQVNQAVGMAHLRGDRSDIAFAHQMAGSVALATGYVSVGVIHAEEACRIFLDELNDEIHGAQALLGRANAAASVDGIDGAAPYYERCIEIAARKGLLPIHAVALKNYGRISAAGGRRTEAIARLTEAMNVAERAGMQEIGSSSAIVLAGLLYEDGELERAEGLARKGLAIQETLRGKLEAGWQRFGRRTESAFATSTLAFIAAATGKSMEAWNLSERLHARLLTEQLAGTPATFVECRKQLARCERSAAIVTYGVEEGELLITVASNRSDEPVARVVRLTPRFHVLVENVQREVVKYPRYGAIQTWTGLADMLLAPIADLLDDVSLLTFVPDERLWNVPLHALPFRGRPLIAHCEVVYSPNATLWRASPRTVAMRSLVVGDPTSNLPFAREEALAVAELLDAGALLGEAATRDVILAAMADATLFHYAGHGVFDAEIPVRSGLVLAADRLTAAELMASPRGVELAVIGACDSGRLDAAGGGEVVGFITSMLLAGASSVIAAQWAVADRDTLALMKQFYRLLLEGRTAGSALREVMLAASRTHHPHVWAPFIVVGNPELRLGGREEAHVAV
jgi:CHAT domain-containing protein